ncbi:hypothetical protein ACHWQZ_G000232 [Mnemiopsis leidyi]
MKRLLCLFLLNVLYHLSSSIPTLQERAAGSCSDLNHDEMDYECLQRMWDFYHIDRSSDAWQPCDTFVSSFSTDKYPASQKCLVYRSKCSTLDNDKPCCKSVHCHLWLMGRTPAV